MEELKQQHIQTKNAILGAIKGKYDYDERVCVGDIIHMLEQITFEQCEVDNDTYSTFTIEDVVLLIENDGDLMDTLGRQGITTEALAATFVAACGSEAEQDCGAAIMDALHDVLWRWLVEAGYADADD